MICIIWGNINVYEIGGAWSGTPLEDVVTDIHSPSFSQVWGALGKLKCGLHLAGISTRCTGPKLVRAAPGLLARIDADNIGPASRN